MWVTVNDHEFLREALFTKLLSRVFYGVLTAFVLGLPRDRHFELSFIESLAVRANLSPWHRMRQKEDTVEVCAGNPLGGKRGRGVRAAAVLDNHLRRFGFELGSQHVGRAPLSICQSQHFWDLRVITRLGKFSPFELVADVPTQPFDVWLACNDF